jgi:hypothetical protein
VSGRKQTAIVIRAYRLTPDDCIRALELLLKKSVSKEGGGPTTAPEDVERSSSASDVGPNLHES